METDVKIVLFPFVPLLIANFLIEIVKFVKFNRLVVFK